MPVSQKDKKDSTFLVYRTLLQNAMPANCNMFSLLPAVIQIYDVKQHYLEVDFCHGVTLIKTVFELMSELLNKRHNNYNNNNNNNNNNDFINVSVRI